MTTELHTVYRVLLIRKREIEISDKNETVKCRLCAREKGHHVPGGRCSCSAFSGNFYSVDADELARIEAALPPIEALIVGLS
jgi:hypothetical protein